MFIKNNHVLFLGLILAVSLALRFYQLGKVPNGLTVDEADMGYNAYSILKTGKDVYGRSFPLFFQSLDDYKAGFGIYLTLPAISIFGLNDFSIRLIPAILGALTPVLVFTIIKLLYPKHKILPYLSAVLVCFAPWNMAISRSNLPYIELIFFYLLFTLLFLLGIVKNSKFLLAAFGILGITLYVYYAAVIYLPLILLLIFIIYRSKLAKYVNTFLISIILLFLISLPAVLHYQSSQSKSRLNAISVLTPDVSLPTSISELQQDLNKGDPLAFITHNRRLVYLSAMLNNYFDYFNLDYLFVNSNNVRYFYVNGVGLFYLLELPFILYGFYLLIRRREKGDLLLLSLLLIGPVPAIITLGSPFPHRGILLLLALQIISAIGIATFIKNLIDSRFKYKLYLLAILSVVYLSQVYFFMHQYFLHSPHEFTSEFDNGAWYSTVRNVIPIVNQHKDQYEKVIFTWSQGKLVPAAYFLFYNQIDPYLLQTKAANWTKEPPSFRQLFSQIGNIQFRPIDWDQDKNLKNTLLIGYSSEFPQNVEGIVGRTYLPNGRAHFLLVKTQ